MGLLPITDPLGILAALLGIVTLVLLLAEWRHTRRPFQYVPAMFWIYSLPMVAGGLGLIPSANPVYGAISRYCLPACLVLLLVGVDLRAILRLGKTALAVMLAGSLGIILGGPAVLLIFKPFLPAEAWKGLGALSASWIGGSANMIAVAAVTDTPNELYTLMVIIDTICPYAWMFLLILLSRYQGRVDRWNRADIAPVLRVAERTRQEQARALPVAMTPLAVMLALAAASTAICLAVAAGVSGWLCGPAGQSAIGQENLRQELISTAKALPILLATSVGLLLSLTPLRRLEGYGSSRLGYVVLYLVLSAIGAQANLSRLGEVPILLAAGVTWILIHGLFILAAGRALRAPMALMAAASQANVGGPASTPVLADVYIPGLAPVGLLLAVLGNIIGTYLGLVCSRLCYWASRVY